MNISIQFVYIESTNAIPDERNRKKRGHVVSLYNSDLICAPSGEYLLLNEPISLERPFAFIHVKNYPISSLGALRDFLIEPVDGDDDLPVNRKWLIDLGSMQPATIAVLDAHRQLTVEWVPENAALLRRLNIPALTDEGQELLGAPATAEELPSDG